MGIKQECDRILSKKFTSQSSLQIPSSGYFDDGTPAYPIIFRYLRDSALFFNSRFESGNIREVEKMHEFEYNLYLNFDFNTLNYTQWFYFSVRNIKKGKNELLKII